MAFHSVIVFLRDSHFSLMFYINTYVFRNCRTLLCALLVKDHNYMDIFSMNIIFFKAMWTILIVIYVGWFPTRCKCPLIFQFWSNTAKIQLLLTHCLILSRLARKRTILYSFWTFSNSVGFNLISKCVDGFKILQTHVHLIPGQTSLKNSSACTNRI